MTCTPPRAFLDPELRAEASLYSNRQFCGRLSRM
jgi:hypothetical protein